MASFVGTNQEFRRYIGPRLRNLVQQITKTHKAEISACEHCSSKKNLESSHVKGRDRNGIIDLVLEEFTVNGVATVDLSVFEKKFKEEHQPLEKSILILCRDCHKKYDSKIVEPNSHPSNSNEASNHAHNTNSDGCLPITLEPSDQDIFKVELLMSKRAEIETTYFDGRVERKPWNVKKFSSTSNVFGNLRSRPEYRSGNWQSKGIIKVHVKVIKNA